MVSWTLEQYRSYEAKARCKLPAPKLKCHQAEPLGEAVPGATKGVQRARVRFIGYRCRPLDPDNFAASCKDLLDGIKHARLIPGDDATLIILETMQEKVASHDEERTEIEIEPISERLGDGPEFGSPLP